MQNGTEPDYYDERASVCWTKFVDCQGVTMRMLFVVYVLPAVGEVSQGLEGLLF